MAIVFASFLLSFDSFFGSFALGLSGIRRSRRLRFALAFGVCDGLASAARNLITPAILKSFTFEALNAVALVYVLVILLYSWRQERLERPGPLLPWTLPVVMSLDNLLNPVSPSASLWLILAVAAASASASLLGFHVANAINQLWKRTVPALYKTLRSSFSS